VHDIRLPGMLHGRVVRPPYAGVDAGAFVGNTLESVDEGSIAHIPGIRAVVVIGDFIGIVAEREEHAEAAMRALHVRWKPWPGMRQLGDLENALRTNPATRRVLVEQGDVAAATQAAAQPMPRTYVWPYQLHASIGPSCAVAQWHGLAPEDSPGGAQANGSLALTVWAGTQNPHVLRADLARLAGVPDTAVDVIRMEASGCYGRNSADDVAADAALLARAAGAPVRVQLSREQEHLWEPKGAAQLMQVDGGLNADGTVAAYDFQTSYPSNGAPTLALLLTGTVAPDATAYEMGDRTAVPPYAYANLRVAANDMAPILRASWLRGVSALPNTFAHESYVDELASAAGADPVEFRLRHLPDARAAELVRATAARAGWIAHTRPQQQAASGDVLKGQGFAYARYVHSKFPGYGAAWSAWVADVEVNRASGEVHVSRVVVGHDAGLMINPDGVRHQVQGNVLQTTSRALKERVSTDADTQLPAAREWGAYPILSFREVPVVEVMMMPRPGEPPLGVGEASSVPGTAAIANAIFDATGVRLRAPPFTPEVVRAALNPLAAAAEVAPEAGADSRSSPGAGAGSGLGASAPAPRSARPLRSRLPRLPFGATWPRRRSLWARGIALAAGMIGVGGALLGWRPVIAPVAVNSANVYSAETIERGRQLAALGACVVCHTAPGGIANAGGRALDTPFGTVYSTNLTPDAATGIGAWSFSAFQRAMREGVSRDGHHLYPAFPYTSFTNASDDDLSALYAYLMVQPAVAQPVPETRLAFPFSVRPLMALWNALYLQPGPAQPPAALSPAPATVAATANGRASALWARGASLVNGLGHCGACHTPRNAFGAEKIGAAYLAGAMVDGWEAPPLTALSSAPLPWSEDALFRYLRFGFDPTHGSASGPMAPVVRELAQVDDGDLRAMAHYLASFNAPRPESAVQMAQPPDSAAPATLLKSAAQRLFNGACGACHHAGDEPQLLGLNLPLALNTNLHGARPDNLIRVILEGIRAPASAEIGFMPAFRDALDDAQVAQLVGYLRQRFAPGQPAWPELEATSARIRATPSSP
jgi:nicotinate dehydrogenase subunit B